LLKITSDITLCNTQRDSCVLFLQAMMATKQSYAAEEAAGRVLPCVAPLAVDPVPEVRHAALATLEAFVKLLQEHSATRDSAAGPSDAAGGAQQVKNRKQYVTYAVAL